jgi:hypothetical protein
MRFASGFGVPDRGLTMEGLPDNGSPSCLAATSAHAIGSADTGRRVPGPAGKSAAR